MTSARCQKETLGLSPLDSKSGKRNMTKYVRDEAASLCRERKKANESESTKKKKRRKR